MVWNGLFLAHFTFLWLQSHSRVKNFSSLFILRLVLRSRKRKIDWGISGVALGQGPQNSFPNQRALRRNAHCRKMDKRGCSVPSTLARVSHRDCQRSFSLPIWWALIRRRITNLLLQQHIRRQGHLATRVRLYYNSSRLHRRLIICSRVSSP